MANNIGSAAYDFSRFENKKADVGSRNNVVKLPKPPQQPKYKISLGQVMKKLGVCALVFALVGGMIYGYVTANELTISISKTEKALNEKTSEYTQLKMAAASKLSLEYVEEYAKTKLGMQKLQPSQIEYVHLNDSDKVEVLSGEDNRSFFQKIKDFFANILS